MKHFHSFVVRFLKDESGQDLIEYALIAALIGLGAVTTLGPLSNAITAIFSKTTSSLTNAV